MQKTNFLLELHDDTLSGVTLKNIQSKKRILSHFANQGDSTLADLSKELNISVPKMNELVSELIDEELVKDFGKIDANLGRKPNLYGLSADSAFFIGVEVKKSHLNIGLMDFKKNLIKANMRVPYDLDNTEQSLQLLCDTINNFIKASHVSRSAILGIGLSLSGRINYKTGYSYNFFNFHETPLSAVIRERLGIRTFLENDSRAMAYGEFTNGSIKTEKNVLFVNLDLGIGMGIMTNGELYYGKSGFAGEFGHIPLFQNEILCHCGKKGCLETEASGEALIRLFKERLANGESSIVTKKRHANPDIQMEDIIDAAIHDDTLSIELIAQIGEKIGKGLALLVNLFNPELIVLGGPLSSTRDHIILPIKNALNTYSISLVNKDSAISISQLGEKAGITGVCMLIRDRLLH